MNNHSKSANHLMIPTNYFLPKANKGQFFYRLSEHYFHFEGIICRYSVNDLQMPNEYSLLSILFHCREN